MKSFHVRPLKERHVAHVVALHGTAFPKFFLTFLGPTFLAEFYRAFVSSPTALAFVAEDESGRVRGVVVGTTNPGGFFRRLLAAKWWAFSLASVAAIFRRPNIVFRLARAMSYRGEPPGGSDRALLSTIAVDPASTRSGIGRLLIEHWLAEAQRSGCGGAYLTTDAIENEAVNAFYRNLGWRVEMTFTTREGREMNRYIIDFVASTKFIK